MAAISAACTAPTRIASGSPRPPARKGSTWRAYLSAAAEGGQPAVNARDRIGNGPWFNSRGVQIAANLEDLHASKNADRNDDGAT